MMLSMSSALDRIRQWDERISARVFRFPHLWSLDLFLGFFSLIGQGGVVWFALGYWLQLTSHQEELFLVLVVAQTLQFVVVGMGIKAAVKRTRPEAREAVLPLWIGWGEYSFPSGHAASSATAWVVLAHFVPVASAGTLIIALLCGLSRLYRHKHYVLDIVCGYVIGGLIGLFTIAFV